uniref:EGF-like domain-containing protein n=1 Tax=Sexangularia sp. CB-2014 TaxID=1486929 RepID=A0A7S1VMW1_9EUKA|mmetsp:Transcript_6580/g.21298  ORF Transcript_6580/g.21298 Transcript_6580/m.21298 type:complete len:171 (+) Transcript_6580:85-597(+)
MMFFLLLVLFTQCFCQEMNTTLDCISPFVAKEGECVKDACPAGAAVVDDTSTSENTFTIQVDDTEVTCGCINPCPVLSSCREYGLDGTFVCVCDKGGDIATVAQDCTNNNTHLMAILVVGIVLFAALVAFCVIYFLLIRNAAWDPLVGRSNDETMREATKSRNPAWSTHT